MDAGRNFSNDKLKKVRHKEAIISDIRQARRDRGERRGVLGPSSSAERPLSQYAEVSKSRGEVLKNN